MAVRVYQLSKEIGMENSDLIALLRDRGHEVKSASSTIDNISAEALREEFAEAVQETAVVEEAPAAPEPVAPKKPEESGAVIRSREDVERERREREESDKAKNAPKPLIPPSPDAFRKSAPALPKGPPVMIRPNFPAALTRPQPKPTDPSSAPTVRSDIPPVAPPPAKREEAAPAAKAPPLTPPPAKASPTAPAPAVPPAAPTAGKPAPLAPPPVSRGPKPLAPPKISAQVFPVLSNEWGHLGDSGFSGYERTDHDYARPVYACHRRNESRLNAAV